MGHPMPACGGLMRIYGPFMSFYMEQPADGQLHGARGRWLMGACDARARLWWFAMHTEVRDARAFVCGRSPPADLQSPRRRAGRRQHAGRLCVGPARPRLGTQEHHRLGTGAPLVLEQQGRPKFAHLAGGARDGVAGCVVRRKAATGEGHAVRGVWRRPAATGPAPAWRAALPSSCKLTGSCVGAGPPAACTRGRQPACLLVVGCPNGMTRDV